MGFDFSPTLWFVCRLCRGSFASTETLKEHKLACHLGECLEIKCIIFEERSLTEEWMPEYSRILNANLKNRSSDKECRNVVQLGHSSAKEPVFKNPYVSLTRLTDQEETNENRSSCKHLKMKKQRLRRPLKSAAVKRKESQLAKPKLRENDRNEVDDGFKNFDADSNSPKTCSPNEEINYQGNIEFKIEAPIYDLLTPENSSENEEAHINLEATTDSEFIVSSFFPNLEGDSEVQFTSAFISASSKENQLCDQQYPIFNVEENDLHNVYEQYEHQVTIPDNGATDSNSNLTNVMEMVTDDSHQSQGPQSVSFSNCQSPTATDPSIEKPFMCETCFLFFSTSNKLYNHMLCHSSIKPFKCPKCPSRFKRNNELVRHQIVHGMETNYKCRFCSKCFGANRSLQIHERSHTGDRPFKCVVANCGYAASCKNALETHTRAKHSEVLGLQLLQPFVCSTCGKTCSSKSSLKVHFHVRHSTDKPFQCTHHGCTSKFKLKHHLQKHLKIHDR